MPASAITLMSHLIDIREHQAVWYSEWLFSYDSSCRTLIAESLPPRAVVLSLAVLAFGDATVNTLIFFNNNKPLAKSLLVLSHCDVSSDVTDFLSSGPSLTCVAPPLPPL